MKSIVCGMFQAYNFVAKRGCKLSNDLRNMAIRNSSFFSLQFFPIQAQAGMENRNQGETLERVSKRLIHSFRNFD